MHFDLVDLRLLVAIADAGSLSKAAAGFPIALSAASNRLRRFEQDSGVTVFTRSAEGMALTPAGRLAVDRARRVLGESEQLKETLRELGGRRRATVRLAGTTVAVSTFLPSALGDFLAENPEVDLQLSERNSPDVLAAVRDGEAEIGILDGMLVTTGVTSMPFRKDRLVLLVPRGHVLAAGPLASLKDALGHPFVCLPRERAMQRFIEERAAQNGRPLTIRVRAPGFYAIAQLVARHAGIAMLPEAAAARFVLELPVEQVQLQDAWATRELRACVAEGAVLPPAAALLLDYLSAAAG